MDVLEKKKLLVPYSTRKSSFKTIKRNSKNMKKKHDVLTYKKHQ